MNSVFSGSFHILNRLLRYVQLLKDIHNDDREAKQHVGPRYFLGNISDFGRIVSAKCNANCTRVSIIVDKMNGTRDPKLYVWDVELDLIQFFNFATGCDESDDVTVTRRPTSATAAAGDAEATAAERGKRQRARELAGRQPVVHYWDWEEPRLLVCEAEFVATPDNTSATADKTTHKPVSIQAAPLIVVSLFVTSEHGFVVQDNFAVDPLCGHVIALEIPHYYFVKKVDLAKPGDQPLLSSDTSQSMVIQRVHRDFVGLEQAEKSSKAAMMDFSFYLTLGDMDEAFKAIKVIKSDSVWENMAKMCVKTRRLDVARVCLGSMRNARAAMCLRNTATEPELEARVATLAVQLGLYEDAEKLLRNCKRYDLLNELYQSHSDWDKALQTAGLYDRIHLRTTSYNYAKFLESRGQITDAIKYYEKSNTHRFEVPRMLFDDPEQLGRYIVDSNDAALNKWWAQYMESCGEMEIAKNFYESSKDYLSLARIYCYTEQVDKTKRKARRHNYTGYFY